MTLGNNRAERTPGGDWDDRTCVEKSCETINNMKMGVNVEGECKAFGGCTFDSANYYCIKEGGTVPCSMHFTNSDDPDCPSGCDYSKITESCITAGTTPPCNAIYDQTKCESAPAGCTFNNNLFKCWKTGEKKQTRSGQCKCACSIEFAAFS